MLITLALAMALIVIALATVLPEIGQRIRRDREDELRHRGTAYMRAIQHFYKKFGRYPTRPEELENTNNLRFIRKLYKDPVNRDPATGKERAFKFLHPQDISNGMLGQMPGLGLPGQPGQSPGGLGGAQGGAGSAMAMAGLAAMAAQAGGMPPTANPIGQAPAGDESEKPSDAAGNPSGSSPSGPGSGSSSSGPNGPTFGGGPIVGVASASTSKEKTIHVFNDKNHYKDWLFFYVQGQERGGLLVGPVQPGMPTNGGLNGMMPGAALQGQTPGLGQASGLGQGQGVAQPQAPSAQTQQNQAPAPPEQ